MKPLPAETPDLLGRAAGVADLLAADPRVQLVFVFGSALDLGGATPRDLDIAVVANPPLSLDELVRLRAEVRLATATPIDLVSLDDAPIVLAHEIVKNGRCLFSRDPAVETDVVTRTHARYWDFEPYRREQWRLAGLRLQERLGGS